MELALAARRPLGHQQRQHEQQRHQRDLRRAGQARALQPGDVDAHRQGRDAEVLHGAKIVEALHQRQRHAGGKRRPCQRQRHRPEGPRGGPPQRARHLQHADRLLHEARPRREIDIRIEHGRQHEDGARQRAHLGEPVILDRVPAEQGPQSALHGAGEVEQLHIRVGDDVGRHGQRQHQQAVERPRPGKRYMVVSQAVPVPNSRVSAPTPASSRPVSMSAAGQYRAHQVRPHALGWVEREHHDRRQRQRHDAGEHGGEHGPARRHAQPLPPARQIRRKPRSLPAVLRKLGHRRIGNA